jgi:RES domain-containing protein
VRVFRLCRAPFRALDGEGARLYGGRWNAPGRPVVYTAGTLALAALEYLVHVDPDAVPGDLVALTIDVPDDAPLEALDAAALPGDWARASEHPACRERGEAWLRAGRALALRVPSALVPEETNVLLNPGHPDAGRVRVVAERAFAFDPRLTG